MVTKELDKKTVSKLAIEVKAKVFELEQENDRYIYVFRSKGGWWKMGGLSALFYANIIAEKLALRKPKILKDSDHYSSFSYGVVSKKDIKKLADEMKQAGLKTTQLEPAIIRFEFEKPIEEDIISTLAQARDTQNERANKLVDTQLLLPKMHLAIRDVMKMIWYYTEKHRENMAKKVLLPGLLEKAMSLKRVYSRTSNRLYETEEGLLKVMEVANDMMADVAFLKEVDELSMTDCNKIQNKLGEIIHSARIELSKIERKKHE